MNLCDQLSPHLLWRCGAIKTTYPDFKLLWRNQQEIQYDGFLFFFLFKKRKKNIYWRRCTNAFILIPKISLLTSFGIRSIQFFSNNQFAKGNPNIEELLRIKKLKIWYKNESYSIENIPLVALIRIKLVKVFIRNKIVRENSKTWKKQLEKMSNEKYGVKIID